MRAWCPQSWCLQSRCPQSWCPQRGHNGAGRSCTTYRGSVCLFLRPGPRVLGGAPAHDGGPAGRVTALVSVCDLTGRAKAHCRRTLPTHVADAHCAGQEHRWSERFSASVRDDHTCYPCLPHGTGRSHTNYYSYTNYHGSSFIRPPRNVRYASGPGRRVHNEPSQTALEVRRPPRHAPHRIAPPQADVLTAVRRPLRRR